MIIKKIALWSQGSIWIWIDRWIDKLWYINTMEYYLSIKRNECVSWTEVDEPRACYTEWIKSEREKQMSYINVLVWRRQWHPTPVLLPGKSHGWRSLVGYSPWGHKESDTTERLHFPFSLSCIGKGNGNPLQCSCLENPRDGGAWWAAVYGVAQSWTRLKRLSSSSSVESRKRYWWTYLQDNRDANVENRLVGTAGEGEGGTNWESSADIFILPPAKQRLVGSSLITQGAEPSAPDDLEGWGGGWAGRDTQEGGDICTHTHTYTLMADLCCCMAETNTTV